MKKTNIAIAALSALLLTGYSGCFDSTNTTRGMKEDYANAKGRIAKGKQDAATTAKDKAGKGLKYAGEKVGSAGETLDEMGDKLSDSDWE